jgi:hypothetical protein
MIRRFLLAVVILLLLTVALGAGVLVCWLDGMLGRPDA